MKTKYIGIESICVIRETLETTIACNIMFEGMLYNEPLYTNIFCHFVHLRKFLKLDTSPLSNKVSEDLEKKLMQSDAEIIQIDLPEYVDKKIEWKFAATVNLLEAERERMAFQCYYLDMDDIRKKLGEPTNV